MKRDIVKEKVPINYLLHSSEEILNLILKFNQETSLKNFREQVKDAFCIFDSLGESYQIPFEKLTAAKYAFVAFIDEMVLTKQPLFKEEWAKHPLQLEYFKEHNAGEGFFEDLSELRHSPEDNLDLLEIYYLCLLLGYKGKYSRLGEEKWCALQENLKSQIQQYRNKHRQLLHLEASSPKEELCYVS